MNGVGGGELDDEAAAAASIGEVAVLTEAATTVAALAAAVGDEVAVLTELVGAVDAYDVYTAASNGAFGDEAGALVDEVAGIDIVKSPYIRNYFRNLRSIICTASTACCQPV